jgi:hypothetical protein
LAETARQSTDAVRDTVNQISRQSAETTQRVHPNGDWDWHNSSGISSDDSNEAGTAEARTPAVTTTTSGRAWKLLGRTSRDELKMGWKQTSIATTTATATVTAAAVTAALRCWHGSAQQGKTEDD